MMTSSDQYDERPPEDTSAEEYHAEGDVESSETGTDYNPATGETDATPHDRVLVDSDATDSDPNAASSAGLQGDMGISSERTGPADETGTGGLGDLGEFQGTGTVGTARGKTHGTTPTTGGPALSEAPGRDPEEDLAPEAGDDGEVRRTVGESNPAEVPPHELGNKNPGHSGS